MTKPRTVVLTDGEHYPAVTHDAILELGVDRDIVAAVFIGGTEKIGSDADLAKLGVPVIKKPDYLQAICEAIDAYRPEEIVDLSDEPVVGYRERFAIASTVLARGVVYEGADFRFAPPRQAARVSRPSISVVGTGKRIGKTAVGGFVARTLAREFRPVVVTMGRGGPAEPELIPGAEIEITPEYLLSVARQGRHASSDHFEDALTSRVTTIGCRRCGGGMSGQTFTSNVEKGARLSETVDADIVVFEGSGSTIPSVHTDGRILVVGANQPQEYLASYLGPYRVLTSDLIILTMCESPIADQTKVTEMVETIGKLKREARVIRTVFRPRPLGEISGKRIVLTLTTPPSMARTVAEHLEANYGCKVAGISCHLSNRPLLRGDLASFENLAPEVVVTELKAAAVDVVTAWGIERGYKVVYMDNEPVPVDPSEHLDEEVLSLARRVSSNRKP